MKMNHEQIKDVLPQKGPARAIDEVLAYSNGVQLALFRYFPRVRPTWVEIVGLDGKLNDGPFSDQTFPLPVKQDMEQLIGHFPDMPVMPGHHGMAIAMSRACQMVGASYSISRIKAEFNRPVFLGDYNVRIKNLSSCRSAISFSSQILDSAGNIYSDFKIEAGRNKIRGTCRPNQLIEAGAHAATLHCYNRDGKLESPIIFRSVEAEFYEPVTDGDQVFILTHNDKGRGGAIFCYADFTNQQRQFVARMKIKGAPIPLSVLRSTL